MSALNLEIGRRVKAGPVRHKRRAPTSKVQLLQRGVEEDVGDAPGLR